jgi:hypothetical protein
MVLEHCVHASNLCPRYCLQVLFYLKVVSEGTAANGNNEIPPGTKGSPTGSLPCVNNVGIFEAVLHKALLPIARLLSRDNVNQNSNSNNSCSVLHECCGGEGWNGPLCCVDGTEFIDIYTDWPQCMPSSTIEEQQEQQPNPHPSDDKNILSQQIPSTSPSSCSPLWERCGGENWTRATCCREGDCIEQHPNWFVCSIL